MRKVILIITVLMGITLHSHSQGWFQQQSGTTYHFYSVFPVDENIAYAVADSLGYRHLILKTSNGGVNWVRQNLPYPSNWPGLKSVYFVNANTGFACGAEAPSSAVWRTTTGGANWFQTIITGNYGLRSVWFINASTGIVVGSNQSNVAWIFRSTDGGLTWGNFWAGAGNLLHSVYFTDALTGYACGEPGIIIKTTNAGINWVQQTSNTATVLRGIFFINSATGWTVGTNSRVYKTTNGGSMWVDLSSNFLCGLYSVYFTDALTGWVVGCEGSIHRSTNGGANWVMQSFAGTTYLYSVRFVNPNTGWAVGALGRILKTTSGGITGIAPINNEIPIDFKLEQNFPNPFNPVTNIKFQIPKSGFAEVKIFDMLSKEAVTLVSEQLNPGTYEVEWNAANYSSGVYYYKLIAGDYSETKKMILIK